MAVIALWSSPRSRSTAFFRSMAERGDLVVLHEPLWNLAAHGETGAGGQSFRSATQLLDWLRDGSHPVPVFLKETTDHRHEIVLGDRRFLAEARHGFLIRRPEEIAPSYRALWPDMRIEEVGLERLHELYTAVLDAGGPPPVVVDSDDLVARPEATMAAFCAAVDLPFLSEALRWQPGERPEWRRSADWHVEASASSGFAAPERSYAETVESSEELARFAAHHRPFYESLLAHRLPIDG